MNRVLRTEHALKRLTENPHLVEASGAYSQFGEDAILRMIFETLGIAQPGCVEFGANDGLSCSNTALWWHGRNAPAMLIEKSPELYDKLVVNARGYKSVFTLCAEIGVNLTLDDAIAYWGCRPDLISVDIDGDDWHVVNETKANPLVWVVEYNQTLRAPPGEPEIDFVQQKGDYAGCSILALEKLMLKKGYMPVAYTHANGIFVRQPEAAAFKQVHCEHVPRVPIFAASDYKGGMIILGAPPWGVSGKTRSIKCL